MPKLTMVTKIENEECPIRSVLDHVGDKWSVLIFVALKDEAKRFNEIKRLIGDISQRVLTSTLRRLEADGYISRKVYPTGPPQGRIFADGSGTRIVYADPSSHPVGERES